MGRRKIPIKKIASTVTLQTTYTKRRDGILKKANELSILCDADVGLLMFSPTGRLTKFSSCGSIEDMFLRYIDQHDECQGPVENEERLYRSLKHSKYEEEMLEMIAKKEALERKLLELNKRHDEVEEKMSFYQPKVENINTIREANMCQQHLNDAIQRVEKLKEKLQ
ncbi:agamous-like MADS-box protein AGL66 [Mangifera indica]|uniref:agamous-like MADS-box protein AGL66 n=1 Tax=Mangifera indica TaxID=29780 RepID=UPI001CFC0A7E|nr:agamous-like MADS-box protein AGL66 [Mangifera indica]